MCAITAPWYVRGTLEARRAGGKIDRGGQSNRRLGRHDLLQAAPAELSGEAGATIEFEAVAQLTTTENTGADGAQGWSIGLSSSNCLIVDQTIAGTVAALEADGGLRKSDGFEQTELTEGEGNQGVISAVVLSFEGAASLPPDGNSDLLRVTASTTVPDPVVSGGQFVCAPKNCRIFYKNGLVGDGQPVDNKVTYRGLAYRPNLLSGTTDVCPEISTARPDFELSISAPTTFEGEAGSTVQIPAMAQLTTSS